MQIPVTSRPLMLIPVTGPADPAQYPAEIAVMPDDGSEPGPADWVPASWIGQEAGVTIGASGAAIPLGAGFWYAWLRLDTGTELVVLPSGRIRVGDPRL